MNAVPTKTTEDTANLSIGSVERDTGIGRDTLRVWERRYGFPSPERDAKGERSYSAGQVRRLQLIRRLLDQGLRPGKVVPLDDEALSELSDAFPMSSGTDGEVEDALSRFIALAVGGDIEALIAAMEQALAQQGVREFVLTTFAPLARLIGEQWAGGRLEIFEEHLLTGQMSRFLEAAMSRLVRPPGNPRVLLATLPGERHSLGLLMVEALLWHARTPTLNLGADIPVDQIVAAVNRSGVSTLALSFSACYPRGPVGVHLTELRALLPPEVTIWIGGAGVQHLRRLPATVVKKTLESL